MTKTTPMHVERWSIAEVKAALDKASEAPLDDAAKHLLMATHQLMLVQRIMQHHAHAFTTTRAIGGCVMCGLESDAGVHASTFDLDVEDITANITKRPPTVPYQPAQERCVACDHTKADHLKQPRHERTPPTACLRGTGDGSVCSCEEYETDESSPLYSKRVPHNEAIDIAIAATLDKITDGNGGLR